MGRCISDNLKKRFGDPANIEIKYAKKRLSLSEEEYLNGKTATAYTDILKSLLGREPTQDEVLGKVDVSKSIATANKRVRR